MRLYHSTEKNDTETMRVILTTTDIDENQKLDNVSSFAYDIICQFNIISSSSCKVEMLHAGDVCRDIFMTTPVSNHFYLFLCINTSAIDYVVILGQFITACS